MSPNGNSSEEVKGFQSVFNAISAPQGVSLGRFLCALGFEGITQERIKPSKVFF
jgi:hypothetical protein